MIAQKTIALALLAFFCLGHSQSNSNSQSNWHSDVKSDSANESGNGAGLLSPRHPGSDATNWTAGQTDLYREMAASGNSTYLVGSVMAWGGLAAELVGGIAGQSVISDIGGLSLVVGIPVLGIGAGKVQDAALALNPGSKTAGDAGWPLYWGGWAAEGVGVVVLVSGVQTTTDAYGDQSSTISSGAVATGIILILGGEVCQFVSWYEFSHRRSIANIDLASLSILPTLHLADNRPDGLGLNLAVNF